jgi:hypothetical protein
VSFHVEVRRSFYRARVFNLSEEQVRRRVLEPWLRGATVELGDREWRAADSKLTVLEGQALNTAEMALGQGWSNAIKAAEDVTAELLAIGTTAHAQATIAVLADTPTAGRAITTLLHDLGLRPTGWESLRPGAAGSGIAAAVVALDGPLTPALGLAVGVALGALGEAAILVRLGSEGVPGELAHLAWVRGQLGERAWIGEVAERLRDAGCTLRPRPGWDAPERFTGP